MKLIATDVISGAAQTLTFAHDRCSMAQSHEPTLTNLFVSPGWLDVQVNGFAGFDLNAASVQPTDVVNLTQHLWREGVARFCPTVITQSATHIEHCLRTIATACTHDAQVRASVAGIHLEGPYISSVEGARGAHPHQHIRPPDWDEFARFQAAAQGNIRIITLAPEIPDAIPFIQKLVRGNVVVAIGHTLATTDQLARAADAGATLSTHLGNGAPALLPRHPNVIWDQLADDRLYASVIFDGHHLPPSLMRVLVRAKPKDKLVLVSDAVALARMPPGVYESQIGGRVELFANGHLAQSGTPYLAGSASSLKDGIENAVKLADSTLAQACQMASTHAAALLGQHPDTTTYTVFEWDAVANASHIIATIVGGHAVWLDGSA